MSTPSITDDEIRIDLPLRTVDLDRGRWVVTATLPPLPPGHHWIWGAAFSLIESLTIRAVSGDEDVLISRVDGFSTHAYLFAEYTAIPDFETLRKPTPRRDLLKEAKEPVVRRFPLPLGFFLYGCGCRDARVDSGDSDPAIHFRLGIRLVRDPATLCRQANGGPPSADFVAPRPEVTVDIFDADGTRVIPAQPQTLSVDTKSN